MERDEWEARAFVQEKRALTEPGLETWETGKVEMWACPLTNQPVSCFFFRFNYFPPHPRLLLPKKSDTFGGKDTQAHSITSWDSFFSL